MKKYFPIVFAFFILSGAGSGCHSSYHTASASFVDYRITSDVKKDPAVIQLMTPYSDSVNRSMNDVVGTAAITLEKKQPEGTLGNFMTDALLFMSRKKIDSHVDAAFVNYGGVRLNQIPAGPVTRGKIFELMPFDNLLVVQKLSGAQLQQLLDLIAAKGGWPVAGLTMQMQNKKAVNVMINGKSLDASSNYLIANSDYVANGGEDASFLKPIPQANVGYLVRDAFFDYIDYLEKQGKNISATEEKRVVNVE
jgi:2',3'-cyclic-nucleotide 2'-phosphodiesterase (5'-nucleotidase family)